MKIITDYAAPIPATPQDLSGALAGFKYRMVLNTESELGWLAVAWRDGERCITQERRRQIRTTGPLAADHINTLLQRVLRNDPGWDTGLEWHALPNRDLEQLRFFGLIVGPILFPPAWLAIVLIWVPRLLYYGPRCRAYAAAHAYTLIAYRSDDPASSGAPACVMAEGYVPFDTVTATSPPLSELSYRLFEQGFFQPLMWAVLLAIVFLLYRWLKRVRADRLTLYPPVVLVADSRAPLRNLRRR